MNRRARNVHRNISDGRTKAMLKRLHLHEQFNQLITYTAFNPPIMFDNQPIRHGKKAR